MPLVERMWTIYMTPYDVNSAQWIKQKNHTSNRYTQSIQNRFNRLRTNHLSCRVRILVWPRPHFAQKGFICITELVDSNRVESTNFVMHTRLILRPKISYWGVPGGKAYPSVTVSLFKIQISYPQKANQYDNFHRSLNYKLQKAQRWLLQELCFNPITNSFEIYITVYCILVVVFLVYNVVNSIQ